MPGPIDAPGAPAPAWALEDALASLVRAELGRLRREPCPPPEPDRPLTAPPLAVDSIELLELAAAAEELLQLGACGAGDHLLRRRSIREWAAVAARLVDPRAGEVCFRSSGSSGEPKRCSHTWPDLLAEARVHATHLAGTRRVLCLAPAHHIYGFLFGVLLGPALGASTANGAAALAALHAGLRAGDLVVGFPELWAYISRALPRIPGGVQGVTSTAPCDPALWSALLAAGLDRLTEVYGSTETGGIGLRAAPGQGFLLLQLWERAGPEGLRRRRDGGARGPVVTPPDRLTWRTADRFIPAGRRDGAVQVAGVNVHPPRVAEAIRAHPAVQECAVRPMRPEEGGRLKAFIVLEPGGAPGPATAASLRSWMAGRLAAPERPAAITFGSALPRGATGKPGDW